MEVFDPVSGAWDATKCNMTSQRCGHALAVLDGALHAVGGDIRSVLEATGSSSWRVRRLGPWSSTNWYDPRANRWHVVPGLELPAGMSGEGAAVLYD